MKTRQDALNDLFATLITQDPKGDGLNEVGRISRHSDGERLFIQYATGEEFVIDIRAWQWPHVKQFETYQDDKKEEPEELAS